MCAVILSYLPSLLLLCHLLQGFSNLGLQTQQKPLFIALDGKLHDYICKKKKKKSLDLYYRILLFFFKNIFFVKYCTMFYCPQWPFWESQVSMSTVLISLLCHQVSNTETYSWVKVKYSEFIRACKVIISTLKKRQNAPWQADAHPDRWPLVVVNGLLFAYYFSSP